MRRLDCLHSIVCAIGLSITLSHVSVAQDPRQRGIIGLYRDTMAPGVIGRQQLERNPMLRGYLQPVEIQGPKGSRISLVSQGTFVDPQPSPVRAAMLVGAVYRFQLSSIPNEDGIELFPTLEVIDRLYPPAEREHRFPIPIAIDDQDIQAALRGDMVMRVIYLEDSEIAPPESYADGIQRVHDVTGTEQAVQAADHMGRPVAILRIGSRVPDAAGPDEQFFYGSPPWSPIKEIPNRETLIENHGWPRVEYPEVVPADQPAVEAAQRKLDSSPKVLTRHNSRSIGG